MFYSEKSIHRKLRTQQFVQKVNKKMETAQPKTDVDAHTKKILAVRALIRERDAARNAADFGKSDTLRDRLKSEFDVIIFDQNGGPSGWKFKDGSSKKLPPGLLEQELPGAIKRKRDESDNSAKKQKTTTDQPKLKVKPVVKAKPSEDANRNNALAQSLLAKASADKTVQGVKIEDLKVGNGPVAQSGHRIKVHYVGKLTNGKTFDACTKKPFPFRLGKGEVIRGWDIGCEGMKIGGKRRLTIPPEKAYGKAGAPPTIPGNATLVFEVTLLEVA